MATIDYFLSGDPEAAKHRFMGALAGQGYTVTANPNGTFRVERGSKAATLLLGGLAGKGQLLVFSAQFFQHGGALVARIERESGGGAMGGAIGVSRSTTAFAELDHAIGQSMTSAGILMNVVRG